MAEFYGTVTPLHRLARRGGPDLSRTARQPLAGLDSSRTHGCHAALPCRYFGISRQTCSRGSPRFNPRDLTSLEPRSHRPHRRRQPTWTPALGAAVRPLRETDPRWGQDKRVVWLRREGWTVSPSRGGRILLQLQARGVLRAPPPYRVSARQRVRRVYAIRQPKAYVVAQPGDRVQVDPLDVRPLPGVILQPCTARDGISRWEVL